MADPDISVVVPSHDRPLRLRWLLNALEEQTLAARALGGRRRRTTPRGRRPTRCCATTRSLAKACCATSRCRRGPRRRARTATRRGGLRARRSSRSPTTTAVRRPTGSSARSRRPRRTPARSCRARRRRTRTRRRMHARAAVPQPDRSGRRRRGRECLQHRLPARAARAAGRVRRGRCTPARTPTSRCAPAPSARRYVGAPEVLTHHAVVETTLVKRLRGIWRWQDLPRLVQAPPGDARRVPARLFWKRTHVWFPLAVAGAVLERRNPLYGVLAVPWVVHARAAARQRPARAHAGDRRAAEPGRGRRRRVSRR